MDVGTDMGALIGDSFGVYTAEGAGGRGSFRIMRSDGRGDFEGLCGVDWCICSGSEGREEGGGDVVDCLKVLSVQLGISDLMSFATNHRWSV